MEIKKESLAKKLHRYIQENKEFTLQELYKEFGDTYTKHGIRARLYETDEYKEKQIIKTKEGVYALCGVELHALVEKVDTREHMYKLSHAKLTYDVLVLDPPYATNAQKGGNRQLTDFDFISPAEFKRIVAEARKLLKNEYSQIVMMISGGKSGKRQVDEYLRAFDENDLKLSNRGSYRKYNKNGSRCNMGKFPMPDEQILTYSISGEERPDIDTSSSTEYHFTRPPLPRSGGYSTQKPLGMIKAILERTTKAGERVLDCFLGSGVVLEASLLLGRVIHGLEISGHAIDAFILPRMRNFATVSESTYIVPHSAQEARQTTLFDFM